MMRYRARQFWHALTASPAPDSLARARRALSPAQYTLFTRLQPSEQAHALTVLDKVTQHSDHPDLHTAALLHDIGKILRPLKLWERVYVVLAGGIQWGNAGFAGGRAPKGLRGPHWLRSGQALKVAALHPHWGADLAHKAGVTPLAAALIRRHQDAPNGAPKNLEDQLLAILQSADNDS
jgi:hypothetical protein